MIKYIISLLFLLTWNLNEGKCQEKDTLKVLFVGNSYTYFWNLPQLLEAMGEESGTPIMARQSTSGGTSLEQHWKGEKELKSRELIIKGGWDVVVLQNHSQSTIDTPDSFFEYGKKFTELIRKNKAEPFFYQTWPKQYNPVWKTTISESYSQIAKETGSSLVPVGDIWVEVTRMRPDLELYDPDGSHPSPAGTYLAAIVFYKYLTGESVLEIPARLLTTDKNGEKLYLAIMPLRDADFMQDFVEMFFNRQKEKND